MGKAKPVLLSPEPNTNLLYPRTVLPTLELEVPEGVSWRACAVVGSRKTLNKEELLSILPKVIREENKICVFEGKTGSLIFECNI